MVKVLVVEDEASIREMIALNLRLAGMEAVEADSAEAALPLLEQRPGCDAAILDVMLPGMNGFSLCETIRRTDQKIGIIILSAKGQEQDKIRGLSIGADDYMTKPFSVSELLARVEALCRRVGRSAGAEAGEQAPASLVSGSFVLDENRRVLLKAGKPIELTQVEFQIMELFFRNPGVALVRERILKGVWGENYFGDVKIVDVNIRRLRMKVEDEPSHPAHILTVWGYGYQWEEKNMFSFGVKAVSPAISTRCDGCGTPSLLNAFFSFLRFGFGTAGAAGGGHVPLQRHPQLLQRRPADHVPPLFVHHRSAQNVHRRNEPEDRRQPQRGSASDGGAVLR